ncbi:MAG: sulfatase-like hydrolase/transferase [Fuerstiella sp.]
MNCSVRWPHLLLIGCLALVADVAAARQPNIVFILADDLGYGDLGVTGHPYVQSPNIDGLAKDGLRLENAYMCGAWCAPSRSALMSGLFPARYFNRTHVLAVERPSLTSVLKNAGYTTAHYGKWHIGKDTGAPPPADYGIDESLTTQSTGPTWPKDARQDPHYRENTTPHYVDLAIDFMTRNREQPLFINLWVYPTHSYINPTPEQLAVYKDLKVDIDDFEYPLQREFLEFVAEYGDVQDAMRAYCADATALDTEIGRLLKSLKDLKLDENTIVIFSSDNGPGPLCGNWDSIVRRYKEKPLLLNNVGSAGPYRDRKISLHDGGIHAPFFVRWPAKIKAGSSNSTTLFSGVDLLPTLATLAGADVPDGIDGEDLSAAWLGKSHKRAKPIFWNDKPGWSALRDRQWKAHLRKGEFRLFDLSKDPSESNDVAEKYPDVANDYLRQLKQWESSIFSKKE